MQFSLEVATTYDLWGNPRRVTFAWLAPDRTWRRVEVDVDPDTSDEELATLIHEVEEAVAADPF